MRRQTVLTRSLIAAALLAGAVSPVRGAAADGPKAVGEDAVVAWIGQTAYTLADIRQRLARLEAPYRYAAERRLPEYVREFARREVLAREARRLGLEGDPEVRAQLDEASQAILIRALVKREVTARAMPTPEAVRAYYDEHEAEFRLPERVEVKQILVATEAQADAIRAAAQMGQSFEAAGEAHGADRADEATVSRGMREPEVERAIFALAVGDISAPVRTREGVYLFRLRARHPAQLQSLEAATPGIQARLAAQNQTRLWKSLQDRLWAAEGVVIRDELLRAAILRPSSPVPAGDAAGAESSPGSGQPGQPEEPATPKHERP
jgi:parvulin-like peptidyl-prolyl isomerase